MCPSTLLFLRSCDASVKNDGATHLSLRLAGLSREVARFKADFSPPGAPGAIGGNA